MEEGQLKFIVKDILDMDSNNKQWEVWVEPIVFRICKPYLDQVEDDQSEYGDDGFETDEQIWETINIEQARKQSNEVCFDEEKGDN